MSFLAIKMVKLLDHEIDIGNVDAEKLFKEIQAKDFPFYRWYNCLEAKFDITGRGTYEEGEK